MSNENEFYPTPRDLAEMLVERLVWQISPTLLGVGKDKLQLLEPSAGSGSFLAPMSRLGSVTAIDPHHDAPKDMPEGVEWERWSLEEMHGLMQGERHFDIACGNPPFSLAESHLNLLFQMVRRGGYVGFLLRSGFLSSKGRAKFFAAWPPKHVYILASRPSFMWSWTCKVKEVMGLTNGCGHKWMSRPGVVHKKCPECKNEELSLGKTDQYDYCFCVWEVGMDPGKSTTMSWLNLYEGGEGS